MESWIVQFMAEFGYAGVFLLILAENVFPPIPSEVILTFGGFLAAAGPLTKPMVIGAATLGSVAGALVLYGIGRVFDADRIGGLVDRWGGVLRLTRADIERADAWFDRHGHWTVFFCRLVPLVRSLISLPAGMSRMPLVPFVVLTSAGSLLWNTVLVSLGAAVGENWQAIVRYMDMYSAVAYSVLGLLLAAAVLSYFNFRRKRA
ncbi:DedA family protein [Bhargavaea ullalensis]|uniref:Alkaline phosphatase n=1 Tax=Bhargavaea ullalensis TaxID=1265685 RepID=A0ABV2GEA1_9BACL